MNSAVWQERLRLNRALVVHCASKIAGFADVQPSGLIDQFFVAGRFGGQGVANLLMKHIHAVAAQRATPQLLSHVSLRAEALFTKWGFAVAERREVVLQGRVLRNALMTKMLRGTSPTPSKSA